MHWYLIHTKPRQEKCALENLERQSYECYLPLLPTEKIRKRKLTVIEAPLFPRYLFIRLSLDSTFRSWAPIRSTIGVSRLVSFGNRPAQADDGLIELLKSHEQTLHDAPERLFSQGETVRLTGGAFNGIEGIYQMTDGEQRAMVLIELLSKPVSMSVETASLRRAG
ncbi:MAG: transcription/translation regulatory transformer protein RfaH [Azoarcus sp.]|jgi:transcriptional antiterminator RfaH|nr:transcription/translation regulatory transformer protein RfaH [Azoarcus sp.]